MRLTVEIHDVTPAECDALERIGEALARVGVDRPTLLVIPAYLDRAGRRWDLRDHPRAVDRLGEARRRGAELVLHGLTHRSPGSPEGLGNRFRHRVWSRGTAEFAHLDRREAARRIAIGRTIFAECGLAADGFVAPAWLTSRGARAAVESAGFGFTADFREIVLFGAAPTRIAAPVLTFAAPPGPADALKRGYMRAVEARARHAPILRFALHPEDVAVALDHAIRRLRQLLDRRAPIDYAEIALRRVSSIS